MVENFGSQCGYCTPGFIMSLFEGYYRKDLKTGAQLDEQLCGNLCRCTGYRPIRDAAADALAQRGAPDDFDAQLKNAKTKLKPIRYASGTKHSSARPRSQNCSPCSRNFLSARLIAGATELGLEITKKFRKFPVLVSVEAIPELTELHSTPNEWTIGAAVTLTRIDEMLGEEYPELREMLLVFGSRQIRNRATMGGNLVTASPIGDSAPVLLALEAEVVLASATGERRISLDEFFVSYRKTALQPGEILKSIIVPRFAAGDPIDPQILQGLKTARDGYQHGGGLLRGVVRREADDRSRPAGLWRSGCDAGPGAEDGSGLDRQALAT